MAIRTILPQGIDTEADDAIKKFTNIDTVDFDFSWDNKWKRVRAGATVQMTKYLVNYAAYHLARKMFKRDAVKSWEAIPPANRRGLPAIHNDSEEVKLQIQMVAQNPGIVEDYLEKSGKGKIEVLKGVKAEALDNIGDPNEYTGGETDTPPNVEVLEEVSKPTETTVGEEPEPKAPVGQEQVKGETSETPKGFKCDKCDFASSTNAGLKSHMRKHKNEEKAAPETPEALAPEAPAPEAPKQPEAPDVQT